MEFKNAPAVEQICWEMKLADWPRARNRAQLNALANGAPPYSEQEAIQNNINTNVNFLEYSKILHDARRQFYTALCSTNPAITVDCDYGPVWQKRKWSESIAKNMNRPIKGSRRYLDCQKSTFASDVLHGIGPSKWRNSESWAPYPRGIEDVLIPSSTYCSLENLPFFAVYEQYTGAELWKMTHGPNVDPGWNVPMAEALCRWVDLQAAQLMNNNWPEVWSPEKMEERIKQDSGLYAGDAVPTIDTFDFYYYSDSGKDAGWRRKIILDAWGMPGTGGSWQASQAPSSAKTKYTESGWTKSDFLYDGDKRQRKKFASSLDEIIHFQFADASCVAPFRYHSVRSLGFLLYSVCHLQNRLRCRFNDNLFEQMLQYFRVTNPADAERLSKVDLINYGVLPDGLEMVKAQDRWAFQSQMAEMGMGLNRQTMADLSASYTQDFDFENENRAETATKTMAKVNATAAMVGSMLSTAYDLEKFKYDEIGRRFCIKNSSDPEVRAFRLACLKDGVPEQALSIERLNIQPVRVIGSGNKTLQILMAEKLMAIRPILDPQAQKIVDRIYVLANSDDPHLPELLVPDVHHISDDVHDAQVAAGTLMQGLPVAMKEGVNHQEVIETLLHSMATVIAGIEHSGGMATKEQIAGLNNIAQNINQHIQKLAQDKSMKSKVKQYGDDLGKLMNLVKAYTQRLAEQQKQASQNGNQMPPEAAAKIAATTAMAKSKIDLGKQSHAAKTAQRQISFEQNLKQQQVEHQVELGKKAIELVHATHANRLKSLNKGDGKDKEQT